MSDAWDDMRKVKEESYFDKKNKKALARLANKQQSEKPQPRPITGEPEALHQGWLNAVIEGLKKIISSK